MENVHVPVDTAVRKELTSHVDDMNLKLVFQRRYGRGWQRKLGTVLDVPETTVNGWFKSGKFPVLAKLAFGVLLSRAIRPHRRWVPVKNGLCYAVCDTKGPIGRIVADNISSPDDATLLAAAPQLFDASGDAFVVFDDARDFMEGWGELADKLGAGLDAATLRPSGGGEKEKEEDPSAKLKIKSGPQIRKGEGNTLNQTVKKFDNLDRKIVIDTVQERYGVILQKVGRRDKWRRDELGTNWFVLGGKDDWHGIPEVMMENERQAQIKGMLVIAQKKHKCIELFSGPLRPIVDERDKLSRATQSTGDYQFTVESHGNRLRCTKIPKFVLKKLDSIPWSAGDRERKKDEGISQAGYGHVPLR